MNKQILIILAVIIITIVAYLFLTPQDVDSTQLNLTDQSADLTTQEHEAIDILNDEILRDECANYAVQDKITEADVEAYINDCVIELKRQMAVEIQPETQATSTPTIINTTTEEPIPSIEKQ